MDENPGVTPMFERITSRSAGATTCRMIASTVWTCCSVSLRSGCRRRRDGTRQYARRSCEEHAGHASSIDIHEITLSFAFQTTACKYSVISLCSHCYLATE